MTVSKPRVAFSSRGVAVVTGGSAGLGLATVEALANSGMDVVAVSRSPQRLEAAIGSLDAIVRERVTALPGDIGNPDDVASIVERTVGQFGRLDALINCAGVSMNAYRLLTETDPSEWSRLVNANLTGTYLMCRAALPYVASSEAGYVVNVLSTVAFCGAPGAALYAATKYGARALTESLVEEYRGTSVRITSLSPGKMHTSIWDHKLNPPSAEERAEMLDPADVAEIVVWLLGRPVGMHIENITVRPWNF